MGHETDRQTNSGKFLGVQIFVTSRVRPPELNFVVLNFVTTSMRQAHSLACGAGC